MDEKLYPGREELFLLWLERKKRILSFHKVKGFELRVFKSSETMMTYALKLAIAGYKVQ